MKFTHFHIKNFKGIEDIRLDLKAQPQSRVQTLVGLNESGKTTILEALNFLSYKSETLDPLDLPGYSVKDVHHLIPINKRANFNDSIVIAAGYEFSTEDENKIKAYLLKEFSMRLTRKIGSLVINQSYKFENSKNISTASVNRWTIPLWVRTKGARKDRMVTQDPLAWPATVTFIKEMLPSILFFPNFLFEFPDKIYLEKGEVDEERHQFYRTILQDILDSIGGGVDLNTHVLERAKEGTPNAQRALESVLLKMGSHITKTVFQNWDRIFKRKAGHKEIQVTAGQNEAGRWFLQLRVRDANEVYEISERSLGFRWFFAFLLLTQYRGFRQNATRDVLFLLDEPASNLHPSAQNQLLESFGNLPGNSSVIYTTHSHHMINPDWLEGTYVVKNEGLDYESEDDYSARNTQVTLTKYRAFAAKHPNQTTYFQPILDVLDFKPGRLDNVPNVVMAEGKNDYYTMKYFIDKILKGSGKLHMMPGTGSGSLDTVIRLYLAWGRRFIILLDSDAEGVKQKRRYHELFGGLVTDSIFTLEDVDLAWSNIEMEQLVSEAERLLIQFSAYPDAPRYNKTHFNRAIQELYLTDRAVVISDDTKSKFEKILSFCETKLGA